MLKPACGFVPGNKLQGKLSYYTGCVQNAETGAIFWRCEHKHSSPGLALLCAEERVREIQQKIK